jgi:hypothetical protein
LVKSWDYMRFVYETEDTARAAGMVFPPIPDSPMSDVNTPLPQPFTPPTTKPNAGGGMVVLFDPCNVIEQETGDKFESLLENPDNAAPEIQLTRGYKSISSMRGCVTFTGAMMDHSFAGIAIWLESGTSGIGKDCYTLGTDRKTPCSSGSKPIGNLPQDAPVNAYSMETVWDRFLECMKTRYPDCG